MDAGWKRRRLASRFFAGLDRLFLLIETHHNPTQFARTSPRRRVPAAHPASSLSLATMSASAPGGSSNLVSVSSHLNLAPAYAAPPPSDAVTSPAPSTKPTPNASSTSSITPFQPDGLRQLVLDYLINSCYVDSATAFARELAEGSTQADSSGGEGSGRPESAEQPASGGNGASGEGGTAEAMEGVEATPEPFAEPVDSGVGLDSAAAPAINGSGKNVAFMEDGTCEADDDADLPDGALLTKDDVRDLRIRRSACSSCSPRTTRADI